MSELLSFKATSQPNSHEAAQFPGHSNSAYSQEHTNDEPEEGSRRDGTKRKDSAADNTEWSFPEEENEAPSSGISVSRDIDEKPVTWRSLPRKDQLVVLTLARLSEPLTQTSLSAYMFYQLKSFDTSLPDSTIASQGGILQASFPAAQFITAVLWGRAADTDWIGRKRVLLIGLFGTCLSCLGFGFATSFKQAMFFRIIGGAVNGNIGVMRTMISEVIKEKKYQSRAFLILPMCFNIGVVIGPILGGFLADPISSFPSVFGPGSFLGGANGVYWMRKWPYALPNIFSALFILISALSVVLGLDETHACIRGRTDYGRRLGKWLARIITRRRPEYDYTQLDQSPDSYTATIGLEDQSSGTTSEMTQHRPRPSPPAKQSSVKLSKLPFSQIWTSNVLWTLSVHFLLAIHISAFNALVFLFLPAPRSSNVHSHLPFQFSGGLGLPASKVGIATAVIGIIGFPLQILLYPRLNTKLGTLKCYRVFLPFSPLAYTLTPFLALLPNRAILVWPALVLVLGTQVLARTFTLPGAIILINNSSPHPSVLGTVHGVSQSVSAGARTLGPILAGWGLGLGLKHNAVGAVWWAMALVAVANWALLWVLKEGGEDGK